MPSRAPRAKSTKLAVKREQERYNHGPYDQSCVVCSHPFREELERRYVAWESCSEIGQLADLPATALDKHMRATGKDIDRSKNTDALIAMGMEKAVERGLFDQLDADQVIKLIRERHRLDGRIVERRHDDSPPKILIIAAPQPAPILEDVDDEGHTLIGRVVELGPPSRGDKIHERSDDAES